MRSPANSRRHGRGLQAGNTFYAAPLSQHYSSQRREANQAIAAIAIIPAATTSASSIGSFLRVGDVKAESRGTGQNDANLKQSHCCLLPDDGEATV